MRDVSFGDRMYQPESDPPRQRGHDAQGGDGDDQGEAAPLGLGRAGLRRAGPASAAQRRQGEDGEGEDDEVGRDVGHGGDGHGPDVVDGGAQVAGEVDVPVRADGVAPAREQDDVQREGGGGEEDGEGDEEARRARLHQPHDAREEGDEGELGAPERDVDEEQRDPGDV